MKTENSPSEPGFYNLEIGYENHDGTTTVVGKSYIHFNGSYNTLIDSTIDNEAKNKPGNKILSWELVRKGW